MKAVLISIQPKWCERIASGKKTIEVRKTRPKIETPFKCYIYCSGGRGKQVTWNGNNIELFRWNGVRLIKQKTDAGWVEDRPYQTWNVLLDYGFTHQLHDGDYELNGKVIGEFVCDRIICCQAYYDDSGEKHLTNLFGVDTSKICLSESEIFDYIMGKDKKDGMGWLWHISDLKIYDKPKELGEFGNYKTEWVQWYHSDDKVFYPLTRPPQSWCYVEQLE